MVKAAESLKNQWNVKVKKKNPNQWTSGSTELYRASQAPEMHLLGCSLPKLPWMTKRPVFGHGAPVCMGCLLGAACRGVSVSPAPEFGHLWATSRGFSSMARSHHESREEDNALAAVLMSHPLPLLTSLLGMFVQNPAWVGKHRAKIQHDPAHSSRPAFCCCCDHCRDFAFSSKQGQAMFIGLSAREARLSLLVHANTAQIFWAPSLLGGGGVPCGAAADAGNGCRSAMQI